MLTWWLIAHHSFMESLERVSESLCPRSLDADLKVRSTQIPLPWNYSSSSQSHLTDAAFWPQG